MAGFAFVSHCYKRPHVRRLAVLRVSRWCTATNARDCEQTIAGRTGRDRPWTTTRWLWSIKEYKKTRVRYFTDEWNDWRRANLTPAGA